MTRRETKEEYKIFATRLKQLVDRAGRTAAEVAEEIGVSKAMMSYYLSARSMPESTRIYEMAEYFGVDPAWLFGAHVNPDGSKIETINGMQQPRSYQQTFLFDRIANASEEDLAKLAKLLDIIENERNNH